MKRRINKWNLSRTSEQATWNKLDLSNFLKTLPFNSTNYEKRRYVEIDIVAVIVLLDNSMVMANNQIKLTLFDIKIVSNALLEALTATFKVVACKSTSRVCNIT